MNAKIYRGAEEIGGNCIALQTAQTKILMDFGLPLDFDDRPKEEQKKIWAEAEAWAQDAQAVFITHSHPDHYGLMPALPKGTPVFMSEGTRILLASNPFNGINTDDYTIVTFAYRQPFTFRDITVTAYAVDHSAYGACAFCFQAEGKSVLYTGTSGCTGGRACFTSCCQNMWIVFSWKAPTCAWMKGRTWLRKKGRTWAPTK